MPGSASTPLPPTNYCTRCGARLAPVWPRDAGHASCLACRSVEWRNPLSVAGVLVVRDGRVLLGRRADANRPGFGRWAGPAGYIEPGERAEDAAVREIREETGVRARVTGLVHVYSSATHVEVAYVGETDDTPRPTDEMSELRWFAADDLPWDELFDSCGASAQRLIDRGLVR